MTMISSNILLKCRNMRQRSQLWELLKKTLYIKPCFHSAVRYSTGRYGILVFPLPQNQNVPEGTIPIWVILSQVGKRPPTAVKGYHLQWKCICTVLHSGNEA